MLSVPRCRLPSSASTLQSSHTRFEPEGAWIPNCPRKPLLCPCTAYSTERWLPWLPDAQLLWINLRLSQLCSRLGRSHCVPEESLRIMSPCRLKPNSTVSQMSTLPSDVVLVLLCHHWQGCPNAAGGSTAHMLRLLRQQAGLPAAALGRSASSRLPGCRQLLKRLQWAPSRRPGGQPGPPVPADPPQTLPWLCQHPSLTLLAMCGQPHTLPAEAKPPHHGHNPEWPIVKASTHRLDKSAAPWQQI